MNNNNNNISNKKSNFKIIRNIKTDDNKSFKVFSFKAFQFHNYSKKDIAHHPYNRRMRKTQNDELEMNKFNCSSSNDHDVLNKQRNKLIQQIQNNYVDGKEKAFPFFIKLKKRLMNLYTIQKVIHFPQ
jgi:hypothetical protein